MLNNFINKQILRSSILKLLVYSFCIIFFGFLATILMPQFRLMINPVIKIDDYSGIQSQSLEQERNIVIFMVNKNNITKIGDKISKDGEYKAVYATVVMEDKLILVSAPVKFFENNLNNNLWQFKGVVHPVSENSSEILKNIKATNANAQEIIKNFPVLMINCEDGYGYNSNIECAALFLILSAAVLLMIIWIIVSIINPKLNYTNRSLSKYGDVDILKKMVNEEINTAVRLKVSSIVITQNWFIYNGTFKIIVIPLKNIIWSYKFIRRQFISNYSIRMYTSSNQEYETYLLREKMIDKIIQYFSDKLPWMIIGFDEDIENKWNSMPDELIQEVLSRKTEYKNINI